MNRFSGASATESGAQLNILSEIIACKTKQLAKSKGSRPLERVRREAVELRQSMEAHALFKALSNERTNIIAEFKRKSPSKGVIRSDITVETMARYYESGGAAAISVLTEEDYFNGSLDDLATARKTVSLPVLRKDFIVDEYQVYETAAAGADALLLIAAALNDDSLGLLRRLAEDELGMDALVEVHSENEMQRAIAIGAGLIGVNNRDLKTFEVSLDTSVDLAREPAAGTLLISESGLRSPRDLQKLKALGYKGFLIGESLMRAERPDEALRALIEE